jgi:hypothetical protein
MERLDTDRDQKTHAESGNTAESPQLAAAARLAYSFLMIATPHAVELQIERFRGHFT